MTKRKKLILISLSIFFVTMLLSSLLFVLIKNQQSNDNSFQNPTSFPQTQIDSYPITLNTIKKIEFKNIDKFEKYEYTDVSKNEYCHGTIPMSPIPVDLTTYEYRYNNGQDAAFARVLKNLDAYKDRSPEMQKLNDLYTKLFNDEISIYNSPGTFSYTGDIPRSCTGGNADVSLRISQINYSGTDKAYLIIFGGSSQSVADHNWYPLQLMIFSRINDTYEIISDSVEYKDIVKSNHLERCEKPTSYSTNYIPNFGKDTQTCLTQKLNQDLDQIKLQEKLDFMMNIFELVS